MALNEFSHSKSTVFSPHLIARGSENHLDALCVCTLAETSVHTHTVKYDLVLAINITIMQLVHVRPHAHNMELSALNIVTNVFLSSKTLPL